MLGRSSASDEPCQTISTSSVKKRNICLILISGINCPLCNTSKESQITTYIRIVLLDQYAGYRNSAILKTTNPLNSAQSAPPEHASAVTVYELTDPNAAGENFEVLDQDLVHLGLTPFSAKRVVVQLDKSKFVFHSVSHRVRTRTRFHPEIDGVWPDWANVASLN